MYRRASGVIEVFLGHPGGPYFARKDEGVWTLPKGEPLPGEDPLAAARREFEEETGMPPGEGPYLPLGEIKQRAGKVVQAWAFEGDWVERQLRCNEFEIEWPPRSGRMQRFPELDKVAFFGMDVARSKVLPAQAPLFDRLLELLPTQP